MTTVVAGFASCSSRPTLDTTCQPELSGTSEVHLRGCAASADNLRLSVPYARLACQPELAHGCRRAEVGGPHGRQLEPDRGLAPATRPGSRVGLSWTGFIGFQAILDNRTPDPSRRRLVCVPWTCGVVAKPTDELLVQDSADVIEPIC